MLSQQEPERSTAREAEKALQEAASRSEAVLERMLLVKRINRAKKTRQRETFSAN